MPDVQQYEIRPNPSGKYDVYWRILYTQSELKERQEDFIRNGWDPMDAEVEVWAMANTFAPCNPDQPLGHSLPACLEFISSYAKPGDVVVVLEQVHVVNAPKRETPLQRSRQPGDVVYVDGAYSLMSKQGLA